MTRIKKGGGEEMMERVRVRRGEEDQGWGNSKSVANPCLCLSHAVVFLCGPSLKLIFYSMKVHYLGS